MRCVAAPHVDALDALPYPLRYSAVPQGAAPRGTASGVKEPWSFQADHCTGRVGHNFPTRMREFATDDCVYYFTSGRNMGNRK